MRLITCKDQKNIPFDKFYGEARDSNNSVTRGVAEAMLDLTARLKALPDDRCVYALTSHYRLCLLPEDTWLPPWFVIVSALDKREYYIEYLMPENLAPWKAAYVKGGSTFG